MVGQASSHRGGPLQPRPLRAGRSVQAEAVVGPAPVVATPDQPHAGLERRERVGERATATHQRGQVAAEGGIQPLDVAGVDAGAGPGRVEHRADGLGCAAHDPLADADDVALGIALDDLPDQQAWLDDEAWTAATAGVDGAPMPRIWLAVCQMDSGHSLGAASTAPSYLAVSGRRSRLHAP